MVLPQLRQKFCYYDGYKVMTTLVVYHDAAEERLPANLKCHHEVHAKEREESPNTLSINIFLYLPISIYSRDHILSSFLLQKPLLQTAHLSPLIDHHLPTCTKFFMKKHIVD
jgi:hypothetical protein